MTNPSTVQARTKALLGAILLKLQGGLPKRRTEQSASIADVYPCNQDLGTQKYKKIRRHIQYCHCCPVRCIKSAIYHGNSSGKKLPRLLWRIYHFATQIFYQIFCYKRHFRHFTIKSKCFLPGRSTECPSLLFSAMEQCYNGRVVYLSVRNLERTPFLHRTGCFPRVIKTRSV